MDNDLFKQIVKTRQYTAQAHFPIKYTKTLKARTISWYNTNDLLADEKCVGIKTGQTTTAGGCLVSSF